MPLDPNILNAGGQLALGLATVFIPGSGPAVSALAALMASISEYNKVNGKSPDYIPSHEELVAFIEERKSKRIETPGERPATEG